MKRTKQRNKTETTLLQLNFLLVGCMVSRDKLLTSETKCLNVSNRSTIWQTRFIVLWINGTKETLKKEINHGKMLKDCLEKLLLIVTRKLSWILSRSLGWCQSKWKGFQTGISKNKESVKNFRLWLKMILKSCSLIGMRVWHSTLACLAEELTKSSLITSKKALRKLKQLIQAAAKNDTHMHQLFSSQDRCMASLTMLIENMSFTSATSRTKSWHKMYIRLWIYGIMEMKQLETKYGN